MHSAPLLLCQQRLPSLSVGQIKAGEVTNMFYFSNGLGSSKMYSCPSLSNVKGRGDVTEEKQRLKNKTKLSLNHLQTGNLHLGNAF